MEENRAQIENTLGCGITVKKILVRDTDKYKNSIVPHSLFTSNAEEILTDPEVQVVIELIGGVQPAYDYIAKALENKSML